MDSPRHADPPRFRHEGIDLRELSHREAGAQEDLIRVLVRGNADRSEHLHDLIHELHVEALADRLQKCSRLWRRTG